MLWGDWRVCVIESPRSSLNKISCTRQFESKLSLRSFAKSLDKRIFSKITPSLFTLKEGSTSHLGLLPSGKKRETALQCYICPTCPSPAGGSLTHSQALALSKRARDVTALRCSEPLRSKVGGPKRSSPCYAGWDRLGNTGYSVNHQYSVRWVE